MKRRLPCVQGSTSNGSPPPGASTDSPASLAARIHSPLFPGRQSLRGAGSGRLLSCLKVPNGSLERSPLIGFVPLDAGDIEHRWGDIKVQRQRIHNSTTHRRRLARTGPVLDNLGLFHVISSYCGQFIISATACRDMMPDPDFYRDCLLASFEELNLAAKAITKKAARAKTRAAGRKKK